MTVILVLVGLAVVLGVFVLLDGLNNKYGLKPYRYDFMDKSVLFGVGAVVDVLFFVGHRWYMEALQHNGDALNGAVLILIGIIILCGVVYHNVKKTSLSVGLIGSLVQIPVIVLVGAGTAMVLLMLIAWAAETKPTYCINGGYGRD